MADSQRKAAEQFVRDWRGKGDEEQHTQLFWIGLLQNVLGVDDALARLKFEVPVETSASKFMGYADVFIPSARTIIEQKSLGVNLAIPEKRQGRMVTPAEQARDYAEGMFLSQQPRYVITCNFAEFWFYDRETDPLCRKPKWTLKLEDLPKNVAALHFLVGDKEDAPEVISQAVSKEAGKIMSKLHALAAAGFDDPDTPENHHALSVLMTRLMFLMFCEDSGLIPSNAFRNFVQHYEAEDLADGLADLFQWLDTPDEDRKGHHADRWTALPYMDGGLFREKTEVPPLTEDFKTTLIVDGCQEFDWSGVSPTVFGSIFEEALSHDHRRENGQHFTSPENIHKVIDPLFLSGLRAELTRATGLPVAGGARTKALRALHEKLGSISILDPAAGSGNFLTESYVSLRRLENRIMFELASNNMTIPMSFEDSDDEGAEDTSVLVSLRNFHGIELEDFACCVARTALWIAEKQMDAETASVTKRVYQELPLTDYEGILCANALRTDWNDVVPASEVSFVCGNPPFIGQYTKTDSQTDDLKTVWDGDYDGYLDYVTCWYKKAADYLARADASFAFVSTNSICQGQPAPALMKPLFRDGWKITFAHRTFIWDSQADDKAHVHVIIVGMSKRAERRMLWSYDRKGHPLGCRIADNINGYLLDAPNVFITKRMAPLNPDMPPVVIGNKPADGGFLQIKKEEQLQAAMNDPIAAKYVRPSIGAQELINGKKRWCLWLINASSTDIASSPYLKEHVRGVYEYRLRSTKRQTREMASRPALYAETRQTTDRPYLCIPRHFSGGRRYFTVARCEHGEIATDACFMADDPDGLLFAIISSAAFMAWQKAVGGELKSDPRFSNTIVYNNFPLPTLTDNGRASVITAGQHVLDARREYDGLSLDQLYKSGDEFLYPELYRAHDELDAAVNEAFGLKADATDDEVNELLFKLYAEKTGEA